MSGPVRLLLGGAFSWALAREAAHGAVKVSLVIVDSCHHNRGTGFGGFEPERPISGRARLRRRNRAKVAGIGEGDRG